MLFMPLKPKFFLLLSLFIVITKASFALSSSAINELNTLDYFLEKVWSMNPTVQSEAAKVNAAQFRALGESQPLYNPNLIAQGDQTDTTNYSIGLSQTLDLSGKRHARSQVGKTNFIIAQTQFRILRLEIGVKALKALSEYCTNQKLVNLAVQRTNLLKEFVNQVAKKYHAGDISRIQLDQANMVLAEAISQQAEAEAALSLSKQALNILTSNQNISFPLLPKTLPKEFKLEDPARMVENLPQLQLLDKEVEAAQAKINVARTQTHGDPTISVYGGKDDEGQRLIGASVNVPLYVRNNYQAGIGEANNEWIAIDKNRMNTYQTSLANLQGSFNRYQIASQAYLQWQITTEKSLRDGKTLLNKLWETGELSTTDYLIQVKQLIDSQVAGAQLQGEAWVAWFSWLEASNQLSGWFNQQNNI